METFLELCQKGFAWLHDVVKQIVKPENIFTDVLALATIANGIFTARLYKLNRKVFMSQYRPYIKVVVQQTGDKKAPVFDKELKTLTISFKIENSGSALGITHTERHIYWYIKPSLKRKFLGELYEPIEYERDVFLGFHYIESKVLFPKEILEYEDVEVGKLPLEANKEIEYCIEISYKDEADNNYEYWAVYRCEYDEKSEQGIIFEYRRSGYEKPDWIQLGKVGKQPQTPDILGLRKQKRLSVKEKIRRAKTKVFKHEKESNA